MRGRRHREIVSFVWITFKQVHNRCRRQDEEEHVAIVPPALFTHSIQVMLQLTDNRLGHIRPAPACYPQCFCVCTIGSYWLAHISFITWRARPLEEKFQNICILFLRHLIPVSRLTRPPRWFNIGFVEAVVFRRFVCVWPPYQTILVIKLISPLSLIDRMWVHAFIQTKTWAFSVDTSFIFVFLEMKKFLEINSKLFFSFFYWPTGHPHFFFWCLQKPDSHPSSRPPDHQHGHYAHPVTKCITIIQTPDLWHACMHV